MILQLLYSLRMTQAQPMPIWLLKLWLQHKSTGKMGTEFPAFLLMQRNLQAAR